MHAVVAKDKISEENLKYYENNIWYREDKIFEQDSYLTTGMD